MKNVFKFLGVLALVGLLMGCFPPAPIVPVSIASVGNPVYVDESIFKLRFTAQGSNGLAYVVNNTGVVTTSESLVNLKQVSAVVISPRAIGVNSVVPCDAVNAGEGCLQVTIGNRSPGTKTVTGSVNFTLDGLAFNLPFSHTYNTAAP